MFEYKIEPRDCY